MNWLCTPAHTKGTWPLCSAQPVQLFEAALGIQFLSSARGSQGQRRMKVLLGGPGGQTDGLSLLPNITLPAFQCLFQPRTVYPPTTPPCTPCPWAGKRGQLQLSQGIPARPSEGRWTPWGGQSTVQGRVVCLPVCSGRGQKHSGFQIRGWTDGGTGRAWDRTAESGLWRAVLLAPVRACVPIPRTPRNLALRTRRSPAGTHDRGWLSAPVTCAVANVPRRILSLDELLSCSMIRYNRGTRGPVFSLCTASC